MIKRTAQLVDINDTPKEVVVILTCQDWQILTNSLREYCNKNSRQKTAKKLLKSIDDMLPIYTI